MKSTISFIIAMVTFGTIGAVIRFINLPSSEIALFRGFIGAVCLAPFLLKNNRQGLGADLKANGLVLLLSGAALAGNWVFLFEAYRNTTIALAAVSYYTAPVIVMILSPLILKEPLSLLKVACITVTLVGMVLVTGVGQGTIGVQHNTLGLLFGFSAAVCYAALMLLNKFLKNLGGLETTVPQLFLATLLLLPYVLWVGEMKPVFLLNRSIVLLIVLGLVHTGVGFLLFFTGIKGLKAQEIAILNYLDPLTSVLISLFIFKESMTIFQIAGAILICGATLIGTISWKAVFRIGDKPKMIGLLCFYLAVMWLAACAPAPAASTPPVLILATVTGTPAPTVTRTPLPTTTSTPLPSKTATLADTATPTLTPTPDRWQIQPCRKGPTSITLEDDWLWEYSGDIEGSGELDMLLNFTANNEILGFAFDSGRVREYKVSGCVQERNFTMWLKQGEVVEAVIQGEIPAADPRGHHDGSSGELTGDVITGLLTEKSGNEVAAVYLNLSSGTAGTIEHRFRIAGVGDDMVILNAVQQFLAAIANDDRAQVVEMIRFPLKVDVHSVDLEDIQTPESFLAQYDTIFDAGFKEQLVKTFPDYLIADGGNFLGWISLFVYNGGGITFEEHGKVVAIYNWKNSELSPTPSPADTRVPTPTLPADCGVAKFGTPGTQILNDSNTPGIWVLGTVTLCTNFSIPALKTRFDLDAGKVDLERADVQYETGDIITFYLFPINGAVSEYWSYYFEGLKAKEPPQPTYDQCKQQVVDPHRLETEPAYLCVLTNEGRVSRVKVEKYSPIIAVSWIEISFVTWSEVVVQP